MRKVLGVLFTVFVSFCLINVYAEDAAFTSVKNKAQELAQADFGSSVTFTATTSGNKATVNVDLSGTPIVLTLDYNESEGKLTYNKSSQGSGDRSYDTTVLEYIVGATAAVRNQNKTGPEIIENLSSYTYKKYGIEGTKSGSDVSTLSINIKKLDLSGNANIDSSSSTTENPKTGVFAPIAGLSVLIIASVVCLLWISKKNVFSGL